MKRDTGITMQSFFDVAAETLQLEVIAGEAYLDRAIPEAALNRPGLALAGFFQYFANKRVQVFGLAELTYLKNLPPGERVERIQQFFGARIPGVVVTRNRHVPEHMQRLAAEARVPVLKTRMITMDFINAATVIMEEMTRPSLRVHGTMVDIMGIGVLIRGIPGIGKSETALALIERGHSLVADDITVLRQDGTGAIICSAVEVTRYHMEIRGLGIIHVPSLFGVASIRARMKLDLIIDLLQQDQAGELDRTGLDPATENMLGIAVPHVTLPVAAGRDLSLTIEAAALNQKLKLLGHDAAKELDEKLIAVLTRQSNALR